MMEPLKVLLIDDSPENASLTLAEMKEGGFEPHHERVETQEAFENALQKQEWDLVLADYQMSDFSGLDALVSRNTIAPHIPFIIVSGTSSEESAVKAIKAGAQDYLQKGRLSRLSHAIERELAEARTQREHRQAKAHLEYLATHDTTTNIPNRALFRNYFKKFILIADREKEPISLLWIDIDRFKKVNDTVGHYRGNILLREMASRLKETLHESDVVAYMGEDTFAVLLLGEGEAGATQVVRKIMKAIASPFMVDSLAIYVEISIGIAVYPHHGTDIDILFRHAEIAMSVAQKDQQGFVVYSQKHDQHNPHSLMLISELRHAIGTDQIRLHYQPKIDLTTGRLLGVEALIRWQHPTYGFIPPGEFLLPAEQTGLIKPLTSWILKEVISQCALWHGAGQEIGVAVNLSERNLQDHQITDQLALLLSKTGIDPRFLKMEVTENIILSDPGRAMQILTQQNQIGIQSSIDDFGTGYSSIGYLKQLPIHEIKIDKCFVQEMLTDEKSAAIVDAIINLGHNLGLTVVAEGVESRAVWNQLATLGCNVAQGHYISHAIPAEAFIPWLSQSPYQ